MTGVHAPTLLAALGTDLGEIEALHSAVHAKAVRAATLGVGGAVAIGLGAFAFLAPLTRWWPVAPVAAVIVGAIGYGITVSPAASAYKAAFKTKVVGRLVALRFPAARYAPFEGIVEADFRASRLFEQGIDRYACEDLIEGMFGATHLRISEVHAEYKTQTTNSKGQTTTHWHTIFRGWFAIADFNKHFNGVTIVRPDSAESMLGAFGQRLQSLGRAMSDAKLVALEDPEFEQAFAVYGTDQVEARYLLSTSLMRRLLDYRNRVGGKVHVSFVDNHVVLAIPSGTNAFEPPSIWAAKAEVSEGDVAGIVEQIELAEGIVEALNLNTRIWTKPPSSAPTTSS